MKKSAGLSSTCTAILALLVGIAGCQSVPVNVAAPKPPVTHDGVKSLSENGRDIYVSFMKCAMCHRPKPVYDYDPETWRDDILPRMGKKARLKPDDYIAVLAYVTSAEAQTQPE